MSEIVFQKVVAILHRPEGIYAENSIYIFK